MAGKAAFASEGTSSARNRREEHFVYKPAPGLPLCSDPTLESGNTEAGKRGDRFLLTDILTTTPCTAMKI
mgnify:CR=1 FL=1